MKGYVITLDGPTWRVHVGSVLGGRVEHAPTLEQAKVWRTRSAAVRHLHALNLHHSGYRVENVRRYRAAVHA